MKGLINYVANSEPLVPFVFDSNWTGIGQQPVEVEITDARPLAAQLSLAAQGFVLSRLRTPAFDPLDAVQVGRHWIPAVRELVRTLTGAAEVRPWAVNVRFSNRSAQSRLTKVAAPARHVHTDFAPGFDPTRQPVFDAPTLAALGVGAANPPPLVASRPRSWRCFNVWQQITPPPQDTPLALCDARSVEPQDLVVGRGSFDAGTGPSAGSVDLSLFRRNPRHRWYYFSDMQPGETLLFSGLDPEAGPTCHMVPHIAFDNRHCPPEAPARHSIEARVLAVFSA